MSSGPSALFDLDGTLTDPREGILRSVVYALEKVGACPPALESLDWVIGPPLQASLAQILASSDADLSRLCLEHYRERFSAVGLYENRVYDGIPESLSRLRSNGVRLLVATSKPAVYAHRILEHFGLAGYFHAVYGSSLDGALSHKADLLRRLLESEGLDPAACVMVGDRIHDLAGSRANGVRFVGALYGYGSREELADADALVETPASVAGTVASLLGRSLPT